MRDARGPGAPARLQTPEARLGYQGEILSQEVRDELGGEVAGAWPWGGVSHAARFAYAQAKRDFHNCKRW